MRPPTAASGRSTGSRQSRESTHGRKSVVATIDGIAATAIASGTGALWAIDRVDRSAARPRVRSSDRPALEPRHPQDSPRRRHPQRPRRRGRRGLGHRPIRGSALADRPGAADADEDDAVSPGSALVDANAQAVWVVNHLDDKVYEIDPRIDAIVRVTLVGAPQNVTVDSGAAWITKALPVASCSSLVYGVSACPISRSYRISRCRGRIARQRRLWRRRSPRSPRAALQGGKPQRWLSLVRRLDSTVGRIRLRNVRHECEGILMNRAIVGVIGALRHFLQRDRDFGHEPRARPGGDDQPVEHIPRPDAAAPARDQARCASGTQPVTAISSGSSPPTTCRPLLERNSRGSSGIEADLRARG